jgi:hypothetical protein
MDQYEFGEALRKLAMGLGLKTLETLTNQLEPDQLLQKASESLDIEIRRALADIFRDAQAEPLQGLIDRLFEHLDTDQIIQRIAPILAADLGEWFKTEEANLLSGVLIDRIDMDEMKILVAEKIAERIQLSSGQVEGSEAIIT